MVEILHPVRSALAEASSAAEPSEKSEPSPMMALARAASAGDERATQQLLQHVAPRIERVVGVVLGFGHAEADDVTQLALIAFTQALRAFRGECEPGHYASRIAARTAVNARRRIRASRARYDDLADVELQPTATTPHDDAVAERRKNAVRELLGVLPPEQAEALALRVALGWSLEEIAAASSTPLNTVRSRLRLAKEALRRKIESDPVLSEELEVRT
jgi:RNA polymerase sigma factor (sigma-70 family)